MSSNAGKSVQGQSPTLDQTKSKNKKQVEIKIPSKRCAGNLLPFSSTSASFMIKNVDWLLNFDGLPFFLYFWVLRAPAQRRASRLHKFLSQKSAFNQYLA